MRIVHIVTRMSGGVGRHLAALIEEQRVRGADVSILSGSVDATEAEVPFLGEGLTYVAGLRRSISVHGDTKVTSAIARTLRHIQPDVVHTHHSKAGVLGRIAARRTGVPRIVHTFHGHLLDSYFSAPLAWSFLQVERWLAPRTDALVAVSNDVRDQLLARGVGVGSQWHVIPPASLSTSDKAPDRHIARARFGLNDQAVVMGFVGRLEPVKNCGLFLEAGRLVAARTPNLQLLVAGEGSERPLLQDWSRTHLPSRVHFIGWQTDPLVAIAACDVIGLSSRNEGLPVALIEAASLGLPVVATAVGGVGEVVIDGETGILVDSSDPLVLADGIMKILRDPAMAKGMGAKARGRAEERFHVSSTAARLFEVYSSIEKEPTSERAGDE